MFQAIPENVADDWKLVLYILSLQFDDILIIAKTNPGVWRKCESELANAEEYDMSMVKSFIEVGLDG